MVSATFRPYWLRIDRILLWTRVEVSFQRNWAFWVSFFPVGRIIRRQDPSLPGGSTTITTTPPVPLVTSDISASVSGSQRRLELDPTDANYRGTPGTTEMMIALIIQGGLDPQLLDRLLDAEDYLAVLLACREPQRYIDGLYQVDRLYSGKYPPNLAPARFFATPTLIRQCVHTAFVRSGAQEGN